MNDIHSSIADDAKGQKMTNEVALLKLMYLHKKYLVPPHEENIENFLLRFLTFTQRLKKRCRRVLPLAFSSCLYSKVKGNFRHDGFFTVACLKKPL